MTNNASETNEAMQSSEATKIFKQIANLADELELDDLEVLLAAVKRIKHIKEVTKVNELRKSGVRKGSKIKFRGHYRGKKYSGSGVVTEMGRDTVKATCPSGATWVANLSSVSLESGGSPRLELVPTTSPTRSDPVASAPSLSKLELENKRRASLFLPPLPREEVKEVNGMLVNTKYIKEVDAESGRIIYSAKPSTKCIELINLS